MRQLLIGVYPLSPFPKMDLQNYGLIYSAFGSIDYSDYCDSWCCLYHCLAISRCEMFLVINDGRCYLKTGYDSKLVMKSFPSGNLYVLRSNANPSVPWLTVYTQQSISSTSISSLSTFTQCDIQCCYDKCIQDTRCDSFAMTIQSAGDLKVSSSCILKTGFSKSWLIADSKVNFFALNGKYSCPSYHYINRFYVRSGFGVDEVRTVHLTSFLKFITVAFLVFAMH